MPDRRPVAALIVAAGAGVRAGGALPKQFQPLAGVPLLRRAAEAFRRHPAIGAIQVMVAPGMEGRAGDLLQGLDVAIGRGGASRQESVRLGLRALARDPPDKVLIHDAARPLLAAALIDRVLAGLAGAPGACPALPVVDSLRRGDSFLPDGPFLLEEVDRRNLYRVQTPQGFDFRAILAAHEQAAPGASDDAEILRKAGRAVRLVEGDPATMKITGPGDFAAAARFLEWETVTGSGFDVHRFGPGDGLWLCGVRVPHRRALIGHSDADVGLHALTDAVLGALAAGDIGQHFPPGDPRWRGARSEHFLRHAAGLVAAAGGRIVHCDLTLIMEAPRLAPHRAAMLARLADILATDQPRISLKATTSEGLGFTGRGEGIAAQALATVRLPI